MDYSNILVRWSNEHVVADHRDLQASTMALNFCGDYAVFAGRRSLTVINLDKPHEVVKKTSRQSKWEIRTIEWNQSYENAQLFAFSCNQTVELKTLREEGTIVSGEHLHAHSRVISDLNWSPLEPNLLATCSVDTYINIWDVREPRKPSNSFSAVAGASQVKWNKILPNNLATAHESDVRLWDIRKGNTPVQYIAAHLSKIHGLDWSPIDEKCLATSSQDCTVKFWNITTPRHVDRTLSSISPVWRARYTDSTCAMINRKWTNSIPGAIISEVNVLKEMIEPFGQGLITVVVPQLRRGENSLRLWNINNVVSPIHNFLGHTDVVLDFSLAQNEKQYVLFSSTVHQYQLVTWSKDQSLRIWTIDPQLQKACGDRVVFEETKDLGDGNRSEVKAIPANLEPTRTSPVAIVKNSKKSEIEIYEETPLSSSPESPESKILLPIASEPKSLLQEFSLIDTNIFNLHFEELSAAKRRCRVKVSNGSENVHLQILFPPNYPEKICPEFKFLFETSIDQESQDEMLKILLSVCEQNVKNNKPCLEPCLRQLVYTVNSRTKSVGENLNDTPFRGDSVQHSVKSLNMYGCYQDSNVPFPRTCGARFSGAGQLVCFARPNHLQNMNVRNDLTPRSLSALAAYQMNHISTLKATRGSTSTPVPRSQYNLMYPASAIARSPKNDPSELTISSFYSKKSKSKSNHKNYSKKRGLAGHVIIYDATALMPINMALAKAYVLDDQDVQGMCTKNANAAAAIGRKDLVQLWLLVALNLNNSKAVENDEQPWAKHPFGRQMLQSILDHYIQMQDVQTVAMLCCALGSRTENQSRKKSHSDSSAYSPGGSPYHTIHSSDTNLDGWGIVCANLKTNRSNSWSDSLDEARDELKVSIDMQEFNDLDKEQLHQNSQLLDPKLNWQYDQFKQIYARLLYRWNLLIPRAQVLKYVSIPPQKHKGIEFLNDCHYCGRDGRGAHCIYCKNYSLQCVICHVAVKGASSFCLYCGHGGHTLHLMEWYKTNDKCPTGCGCSCMKHPPMFE
ncbi:GATOR complex protein WDR59 [Nymphon striatum]|nr:GATOR complex protein WDR59 [Nymphon striatum]